MKNKIVFLVWMIFMIAVCILIISCIALGAYAYIKYGSSPITEIPSWAFFFMGGAGK